MSKVRHQRVWQSLDRPSHSNQTADWWFLDLTFEPAWRLVMSFKKKYYSHLDLRRHYHQEAS